MTPVFHILQGDSGGPLVCRNANGRWEQFGVTSWGACHFDLFPAVYASVVYHKDWIAEKTGLKFSAGKADRP